MKPLKIAVFLALSMLFAGCASTITKDAATGAVTVNVANAPLSVAAHSDLLAAAKYATDHGYPAVGAVYLSQDANLTAVEGQISACLQAIEDNKPKLPSAGSTPVGPILAFEMAREAVGTFSGIPARVRVLCEPLPIPSLPLLPKLP